MKVIIHLKPLLFFVHIPKSGGTTLNAVMDNNYTLEEFYQAYNAINRFQHPEDYIRTFVEMPMERKEKIKVIRSHFYYGLHQDLEIVNYRYMTLLREPVERVISEFHFIKENESHLLHQQVLPLSFEEFINSDISQSCRNVQTRMLLGQTEPVCEEKDFQTVINIIEKDFIMVGLLERFDETLVLLKAKRILRDIHYVKQNATPQRLKQHDLPPALLEKIKQDNEYDLKLYAYAQERFAKEIAEEGESFQEELAEFLEENRDNIDDNYYSGLRLFRQGKFEAARECFVKSLLKKKNNPVFQEIRARANFYLGEICRFQDASSGERFYRKSLEIISNKRMLGTNNTYMIGSLHQRLGNYDEAQKWFLRVTHCYLQGTIIANAYFHLGEMAFEQCRRSEAREMFRHTLDLMPVHHKAAQYLETL